MKLLLRIVSFLLLGTTASIAQIPALTGLWVQQDYIQHLAKHRSPAEAYKLFDRGAADLMLSEASALPLTLLAGTGNNLGGFTWEVKSFAADKHEFAVTGRTGWSAEAITFILRWQVEGRDTLLVQVDDKGTQRRRYQLVSRKTKEDPYPWLVATYVWAGKYKSLGTDGAVRYANVRVNDQFKIGGFGGMKGFTIDTNFTPPRPGVNIIAFDTGDSFEYEFRGDYVYFYTVIEDSAPNHKGNLQFIWVRL